jgi:predicted TIM-barrel fold metal-dependent hydrolase
LKTGQDSKIIEAAPYCEGPDPFIRAPRLKVPLGATDCHFHILGPPASYPYVQEREYTPPDALPSECQRMFGTLGIQRAVLVQPSVYGEDNRRMEDAARELQIPTRMIVVVPLSIADKELQRLHDQGARGIRFILAHVGGLPISDLERFSDRVRPMGWHIQFLLRPAHIIELEARIASLSTDFVIDHIGLIRAAEGGVAQPAFQALLRLFRIGRCWIKLSGGYRISSMEPPYPDVIPLVEALLKERPDKILWGTDWPHVALKGKVPNTTDLLDLLLDWLPDEEVRKQILATNPHTLFRF